MSTVMHKAVERIIDWNSKRYEQVYSYDLTKALLDEEAKEVNEAETEVNYLKELMDVTYVAIGAMWKYGLTAEQIVECMDPSKPDDADIVPQSLATIANDALDTAINMLGLSADQVMEALLAVCDSNDSKSIKKTAPAVKANAGDKGPYYRCAEPALGNILKGRQHVTH